MDLSAACTVCHSHPHAPSTWGLLPWQPCCCGNLHLPNRCTQPLLQEHAASRTRYDAIRALLRLAAWLGFTARAAAAHASAGLVATMALASVLYSLPPVALLVLNPDAFLRWGPQ